MSQHEIIRRNMIQHDTTDMKLYNRKRQTIWNYVDFDLKYIFLDVQTKNNNFFSKC